MPRAKAILAAGEPLVTSDHVPIETWTLLRYRIRRQAAERFWEGLRGGSRARRRDGFGSRLAHQDFSIVDRTRFAVMRRLGIECAASFDDDFAIFRFGPNRRRAFAILR